jgi:hypothetical protein
MPEGEWNYDRILTAHAQIVDCQNDMMRCLHRGEVNRGMRDRMCLMLRSAADDLERMQVERKGEA